MWTAQCKLFTALNYVQLPLSGSKDTRKPKRLVTSRHHEQPALSKRIKTRREVGNLGKCAHIYNPLTLNRHLGDHQSIPKKPEKNRQFCRHSWARPQSAAVSVPPATRGESDFAREPARYPGVGGEQRQEIVFRKPLVPRPRSQWALARPPGPGRRPRRPCPRSVPRLPYLAQ